MSTASCSTSCARSFPEQVLFGFLLAIRFTGQFGDLNNVERYVYYVTLIATAVALVS